MSTKITKATLTNFQKVGFAQIVPSGNLIVLAGKNGAGKTGALDGIQATLCGHNGREIKRPIKDGHGKATVDLELTDGGTAVRQYTPSGTTLKGKNAEGIKFGQSDIDSRLSSLGIDGRKFISLGEKDQLKALLSIVDLPFVPAELDAKRKSIEAARLLVGQQGKAIGDVTVDASLPTEETSVTALLERLGSAKQSNAKLDDALDEMGEASALADDLARQLAQAKSRLAVAVEALKGAPDRIEIDAIESQIETAEDANAAIRANNTARQQVAQKDVLRVQYSKHTDELANIDKTKADGLAAAEMPIEGLTFDDEGVLYQGVPFSRASGREQLIVSCAMIMATDPEIRVIVIRDGNVLDMEGMQILQDMAEATDFQIFIEIVAEDAGDHEYFFVDGELAA